MTENPMRPAAVWIAIVLQCIVGISILAVGVFALIAISTTNPRGYPSIKDTVFLVEFGLIGLICFACALLAFYRLKISRILPLTSVAMMLHFLIDLFINEYWRSGGDIGAGFLTGWLVGTSFVLFAIVLPSILMRFGKTVNAYFGVTTDKASHLHEPPPPPSF